MHKLSSSLRVLPVETTLAYARQESKKMGITRVTDTTWLDKIGIPVFASIRPIAAKGSLCVNAGKGLRAVEAEVGAYMEAIEFAYAENSKKNIEIFESTPEEIGKSLFGRCNFVDLCPLYGRDVAKSEIVSSVSAWDIINNTSAIIPAELIFIPFTENFARPIFGTSSNGLCSGNSLDEAILHGLCELMERDVQAHNLVRDDSHLVDIDTIPIQAKGLVEKIKRAGLTTSIRYTKSEFGFPYFQVFLLEPNEETPISVASGSGLHLDAEIALIRAICEAAQGRLSHIHGGRDDIIERVNIFSRLGRHHELSAIKRLRAYALNDTTPTVFGAVECWSRKFKTLAQALALVRNRLCAAGITSVLTVSLTPENSNLNVVRVIAPGLESFDQTLQRVGPRLLRRLRHDS